MRVGIEILQKQIGKILLEGKFQSFVFNSEVQSKINVTYLKFENWLHITTSDETAIQELKTKDIEQIQTWKDESQATFEYPITNIETEFPEFKNLIGKKLLNYSELVTLSKNDITIGIQFFFENGLTFTQYSDIEDRQLYSFETEIPNNLREKVLKIL